MRGGSATADLRFGATSATSLMSSLLFGAGVSLLLLLLLSTAAVGTVATAAAAAIL